MIVAVTLSGSNNLHDTLPCLGLSPDGHGESMPHTVFEKARSGWVWTSCV